MTKKQKPYKKIVDVHCHIDLYSNPKEIIEECEDFGIQTIGVTTTPLAWKGNKQLVKNSKYVKCSLGLHPTIVCSKYSDIKLFKSLIKETTFVGEIGLDGSAPYLDTFSRQEEIFIEILRTCSEQGNLVLSVHSYKASKKTIELLEKFLSFERCKVVLHWYTGNISDAKHAESLGCYFSINYKMIKTKKGVSLIKNISPKKILTECDGPFIIFKGKPSRPLDIPYTIELLSNVWDCEMENTYKKVQSNFNSLIQNSIIHS
ncbi:MAG: TatD family hydrolase [Deltaproteobacteria bacterium]|nr:TatD family hydrolase [Candidatus Zymogenaceae bacterium]